MGEYIGIKGVLEGVRGILDIGTVDKGKRNSVPDLLTRMNCAKSMLDGVISELTVKVREPVNYEDDEEIETDPELSPTAAQARDELMS